MMGQNRVGSQPYILQLISKPMWLHLCQAAPTVTISPSQALPWSSPIPSLVSCPLTIHILTAARGKGMSYHIAALLTALQSSVTFKMESRFLIQLSRPCVVWPLLNP